MSNERVCPYCGHLANKDGFTPSRRQRYECPDCMKKFSVPLHIATGGFGGHLRNLREQRRMTIESAAKSISKTKSWLSRIELGDRKIAIDELFELSIVYKMRASEVLAGYERIKYGYENDEI